MTPSCAEIILIGNDPSLAYLISRFAEHQGWRVETLPALSQVDEGRGKKPRLVLFASLEGLEANQTLAQELAAGDTQIGVLTSVSEQARAQELGADFCLLHPLTYDSFSAVLNGWNPPVA